MMLQQAWGLRRCTHPTGEEGDMEARGRNYRRRSVEVTLTEYDLSPVIWRRESSADERLYRRYSDTDEEYEDLGKENNRHLYLLPSAMALGMSNNERLLDWQRRRPSENGITKISNDSHMKRRHSHYVSTETNHVRRHNKMSTEAANARDSRSFSREITSNARCRSTDRHHKRRVTIPHVPIIVTSEASEDEKYPLEITEERGSRSLFRRAKSLFSLIFEKDETSPAKYEKPLQQRILRPPTRYVHRRGVSGLAIHYSSTHLGLAF